MYVAMNFIQARLNPMDTVERSQLSPAEFEVLKESDLSVLIAGSQDSRKIKGFQETDAFV